MLTYFAIQFASFEEAQLDVLRAALPAGGYA
jgi:hypothetical protein